MIDIRVIFSPENATDKGYTVTSSDPAVVLVAADKVSCSAEGPGEATLTITTTDGGYTAECHVVVKEPVVAVDGVSVDSPENEVTVGDTISVTK